MTADRPPAVLSPELASRLFGQARRVHLTRDQILFTAGDPGDGMYLLIDGLLKVSVISPSGAERILSILGPDALVGELSMIDGAPRSATVAAIRDSTLALLSRSNFDAYSRSQPELNLHIIALLARRLRDVDEALTATSLLPLKGRVARVLVSLREAFGKDVGSGRILIHQKISQSDIAAMAGIARENVSRILQEWSREKLVSRVSGYYCLEDNKALERQQKL